MADQKISQLPSGAPAQAGDEYVVARSGANYKLTLTNIAANMPATTVASGDLIVSSGNVGIGTTTAAAGGLLTLNRAPAAAFGTPMLQVGGASFTSSGYYSIGLGFTDATYTEPPGEIAFATTSDSGGTLGSIVFGTRSVTTNTAVTERMRIDSSGNVGIGGTAPAFAKMLIGGTLPSGSANSQGIRMLATIPSGATSAHNSFFSAVSTEAASFTLTNLFHFHAEPQSFGAGSAVTNQYGFYVSSSLTGATNNYGFFSNIASGANRYNFFANGTAVNYFAGNTGIGVNVGTGDIRLFVKGANQTAGQYTIAAQDGSGNNLLQVENNGAIGTGTQASSPYNNTTGSAANMFVTSGGVLQRSTSSLRYKSDVINATHGLSDVLKLRSVTYRGKNDGDKTFGGLIAEEVHDAGLTEFVAYDNEGRPDALHYGNMVALLVKAVQELKAELDALKAV